MYTNADQLINKKVDLELLIAGDSPDIMLITEVIPQKQSYSLDKALFDITGYHCLLNFVPKETNLGASGIRGVAIYYKESLEVAEVDIQSDRCRDHACVMY